MSAAITGRERIEAAIRLELLDRVPIAPLVIYFSAGYNGLTTKQLLFEPGAGEWASWRTFERLGGWDGWYGGTQTVSRPDAVRYSLPMRKDLPGYGLPDDAPLPQFCERQVMTVEDYDAVVRQGPAAWYEGLLARAHPGVDTAAVRSVAVADDDPTRLRRRLDAEGVYMLEGSMAFVPADLFSMARTFREFSLDLARVPDKVLAATSALWEPLVQEAIAGSRAGGSDVVWVGGWRTSASFLSPRQYARFVAPTVKLAVDAILSARLAPLLHHDGNWTPMLSSLLDLPPRRCILAADQETDLYEAKRILGGHMCLMGNVSPQLLTLGTVDQVVAGCRRLIDVVGQGGGIHPELRLQGALQRQAGEPSSAG